MLRSYHVENFKAFCGAESLYLKPITLIYGQNSSGKSSLLQSLLLLKQTVTEAVTGDTALLPTGKLVNLGSFREFIHQHDVSRELSFKVVIDSDRVTRRTLHVAPTEIRTYGFEVRVGHNPVHGMELTGLAIFVDNMEQPLLRFGKAEVRSQSSQRKRLIYKDGEPSVMNTRRECVLIAQQIDYEHRLLRQLWSEISQEFADQCIPIVDRHMHRLQQMHGDEGLNVEEVLDAEYLEAGDDLYAYEGDLASEESRNALSKEIAYLTKLRSTLGHFKYEHFCHEVLQRCRRHVLNCRNFVPISRTLLDKEARLENIFDIIEHHYSTLSSRGLKHQEALIEFYRRSDFVDLALRIGSELQFLLDDIIYLGPLRDYPERYYIFSGEASGQVGKTGRKTPDILFKNKNLLQKVNKKLETFGIGYTLEVVPIGNDIQDTGDVFMLRLLDKYTGVKVSISDVGFGVSQLLPIVVQSMLSRRSTIIIEQPEIHIHPRLQTEIGSLLAECIKPPFRNCFIVETHSEHLLLRLQKLIRRGELRSEDISVVYVDRSPLGSKCIPLRLDAEGEFIDPWPNGFFEESFEEMFSR